jgi:anti-sigma B factor antagonist
VTDALPALSFSIRTLDGLSVVTAPAEITIQNAGELREALAAASRDHAIIVADMTQNDFCDSSGISELVTAQKRAWEAAGEVRLVMSGAVVRRIFKVTGVDGIFRIFGSLEDAVAAEAAGRTPQTPPGAH